MSISFFPRRPSSPPAVVDDREETAYAKLEEARLRVEQLIHQMGRLPDLAEARRQLGLAGYDCSPHMHRDVRLARLALAHERADVDFGGDQLVATIKATVHANQAVEDALADSLASHIQSAHAHVLEACRCLDRFLDVSLCDQPFC